MGPFRKRITVQLSISLAIVGGLVLAVMLFGFQVDRLAEKIAGTREQINERSAALTSLASLRSDYTSKGEAYLNVLHNVIPEKDELIDLSKDFQAIAQEDGLNYGFTFLGETPPSGDVLGSVRFNLTLGGTFTKLLNFLKDMENFRYLISVENVSLTRGSEGNMRMDIRGSVFFR